MRRLTRREALKRLGLTAAGSFLLTSLPWRVWGQGGSNPSRVVLIRRQELTGRSGKLDKKVLAEMLDRAILSLTGKAEVKQAWAEMIQPDDVVGIKSNVWHNLPTPDELEQLITQRVMGAGVQKDQISVDDRGVLNNPVFKKATALINTRPMRTHDWAGVGSLIKNYIMFHPRPYEYHPDTCADLGKLWKKPMVRNKTRLNILVMITPLFYGVGPHHFNEKYTWTYNGLIMGFDPVAVDATGLRIIQAKRNAYFGEERPVSPSPHHIKLADKRYHLGNADPSKIELIRLGWQKDILI